LSGYADPSYAESMSEFGRPRELPRCGGRLLERDIPGTPHRDAAGCYPLFACRDWSALPDDVAALGDGLVSVAMVTDPFGAYDEALLRRAFPDVCFRFKEHFVADLTRPVESFVAEHHLRNAKRALAALEVEVHDAPTRFAEEWAALYAELVRRHEIQGVAAFSPRSLAAQLAVPGATLVRAVKDGRAVGAALFYVAGDVAYYHLAAYTEQGYEQRASFAIFRRAIETFAARSRWLALGAGAGVVAAEDGLTRFKRGWSTGTRTAWFCGRVLDRARYDAIAAARGVSGTDFFPIYRKP
jgi:hypothetical protein